MIIINGEPIAEKEIKLLDYLEREGMISKRIAIEINEEILPKSEYDNCILKDGDIVEVVSFVGGG